MTLTKAHIINAIADQIGFPKNHSSEIVETLLKIIKRTLESGEDVLISGFGKFCVKDKRQRRGRNPATGEEYDAGTKAVCDILMFREAER